MTFSARLRRVFGFALGSVAIAVSTYASYGMFHYYFLNSSQPLVAGIAAADVVALTNQERADAQLPTLTRSTLLDTAAQMKADDMAVGSYYAHVSPDGKTPLYWLQAVGYRYLNAGENLVIDRTSAEQAVSAWMQSYDHRSNILRPQFTEIGIGVAEGEYKGMSTLYVVQIFATPHPKEPLVKRVVPVAKAQEELPVSTHVPIVEKIAPPVASTIPKKPAPIVPLPSLSLIPSTATSTLPNAKNSLIQGVQKIVEPAVVAVTPPNTPSTTVWAPESSTVASSTKTSSTTPSAAPAYQPPVWIDDAVVALPATVTTLVLKAYDAKDIVSDYQHTWIEQSIGHIRAWAQQIPTYW